MSTLGPLRAALVAACVLVSSVAAADDVSPAERLFREGKVLASQRKWDEAIAKYRASQALEPRVGVLMSLGDAYVELGKLGSASIAFDLAHDVAIAQNDDRLPDVEKRIATIKSRVPHLTVRVMSPAGVSVTEDDQTLPTASYGASRPIDAGTHTIVATAKGRRTFRTSVRLVEGQAGEVVVFELEPEPLATNDGDKTQRTVSTGLMIGGGGVTALGLVFGAVAISNWSTVKDSCPNKTCPTTSDRDAVQGKANSADGFAIASTVTIAVGLLALGAGVVLKLTAPDKPVTMGARF